MIRNQLRLKYNRVPFIVLALVNTIVSAQDVKIRGLITARSGPLLIVQTQESTNLNVLLTDNTEVSQIQGVFKARRKQMAMAALIPGLAIQAEGTYDDQKQLVAKSVKFKGDDLQQARSIQAGMHETKQKALQNTAEVERQKAALQVQDAALKQQRSELSAQQQKIASNKAAIDAAISRFGQLDDYYILAEATVYFANGKVDVEPKYRPELLRLAEEAKTIQAFMIEVKGYASSVGNKALNQKLSEDRANNVVNVLLQEGHIPLTNMLAPGAMGESEQVGDDQTTEGQAKNRRVVVRILQNKGIAGISALNPNP